MTKTLVHQSPFGALEIVGVPGEIPAGEPFEIDDALADELLRQSDLYREYDVIDVIGVPLEDLTIAELRTAAEDLGIDVPAKAKKAELIELIGNADIPVLYATGDDTHETSTDQQGDIQ